MVFAARELCRVLRMLESEWRARPSTNLISLSLIYQDTVVDMFDDVMQPRLEPNQILHTVMMFG